MLVRQFGRHVDREFSIALQKQDLRQFERSMGIADTPAPFGIATAEGCRKCFIDLAARDWVAAA